jgi:arylformamidase
MRYATQADLDAQMTLDSVADLDAIIARRTAAAASAAAAFSFRRDIPYGDHPDEKLTILPAADPGAPALIFIHGGFWSMMAASQFDFLAPGFHPFGATLVILDYPLMPAVRMADVVGACRKAVAWVVRDGAAHGIDPARVFVSGNSAGGHLTAEMLDRAWLAGAGLPADAIKGGVAISGLFDLEPVAASFRNDVLKLTSDEVARFSPQTRGVDIAAPVIVSVGGAEMPEFIDQSAEFAALLRRGGAAVEEITPAGSNHVTVVLDEFADPARPLNIATRRMMGLSA